MEAITANLHVAIISTGCSNLRVGQVTIDRDDSLPLLPSAVLSLPHLSLPRLFYFVFVSQSWHVQDLHLAWNSLFWKFVSFSPCLPFSFPSFSPSFYFFYFFGLRLYTCLSVCLFISIFIFITSKWIWSLSVSIEIIVFPLFFLSHLSLFNFLALVTSNDNTDPVQFAFIPIYAIYLNDIIILLSCLFPPPLQARFIIDLLSILQANRGI